MSCVFVDWARSTVVVVVWCCLVSEKCPSAHRCVPLEAVVVILVPSVRTIAWLVRDDGPSADLARYGSYELRPRSSVKDA